MNRDVGMYIRVSTELWALGQVWGGLSAVLDRNVGSLHCGQTMLNPYVNIPQFGNIVCIYIYIYIYMFYTNIGHSF